MTSIPAIAAPLFLAATACAGGAQGQISYNDSATFAGALSGNTVVGQLSDGSSYCEYHDPNSGIFGRDFEVYAGNWRVANNFICYSYPGSAEDCQRALVQGNRITFLDAGNGSVVSSGAIVAGNVCS